MAASAVAICNSALVKIGVTPITTLSDNTKAAIVCNQQYSIIRDFLLCNYFWDFAQKQVALTADVTAPTFEWSYRFSLPTDFLRPYYMYPSYTKWKRLGDYIMSDDSTLNMVYIAKITDTTKFTATFDEAFAYMLAAELAYTMIQSVTLAQAMEAKAQAVLKDVRSLTAGEGAQPNINDDTWLESRFQSSGQSEYFGNFRTFP